MSAVGSMRGAYRWGAWGAGLMAGASFAALSAGWVTPGESAVFTARAMGAHPFPPLIHPLWELIVRTAAAVLPPAWVIGSLQWFTVLCAAVAVGLAYRLGWELAGLGGIGRDRDWMRARAGMRTTTETPAAVRAAAGVWAALLLATHLPLMVAATRPMPFAFHAALHLACMRLLVFALSRKRPVGYLIASAVMGLTLAEDTSSLPLLGCAGLVMTIGLFRQHLVVIPALSNQRGARWRLGPIVGTGLIFLAAWLLPLLINATLLARHPAHVWLDYDGWWSAVRDVFLYSFGAFRNAWPARGWLIVAAVTFAPALLVWFTALGSDERSAPRTLALLLLPLALTGALAWNIRIAPWRLFGLTPLSIAGGVILALWGAAAGALWSRAAWFQWKTVERRFPSRSISVPRKLRGVVGWGVPVMLWIALVGGAVRAWPTVSPRGARALRDAAHAIVRDAGDRAWILSAGWMDDLLRIALLERGQDAEVLGLLQLRQPPMQRYMTEAFRSDPQISGLMTFAPETALIEWLEIGGSATSVIFDAPMLWTRARAVPGPRRWVYERIEPGTDPPAVADRIRAIGPDREDEERLEDRLREIRGFLQPHAERLLLMKSRAANDRGLLLLDTGEGDDARQQLRRAMETFPRNLIPRWNGIMLEADPEAQQAQIARIREDLAAMSLEDRAVLAQGGMLHRRIIEAIGQNPADDTDSAAPSPHHRFEIALQAGIQRQADALESAYKERGLPPDEAAIGSARVIALFEDRKIEPGREALSRLRRAHPADPVPIFTDIMLRALQGDEESFRLAEGLERQVPLPPPVELAVARLAAERDRMSEAMRRLDALARRAPGYLPGLELRLQLAMRRGNTPDVRAAAAALIAANRNHPLALHILGSHLAQSHRYAEAEALLRRSAAGQVTIALLNDLAWTLARLGRAAEAEPMIRQVMDSPEANPVYADTLVEVHLALGHREAALAALKDALDRWPEHELLINRRRALLDDGPEGGSSEHAGGTRNP
jgi:tetratricopeptide (TPR) repeat protein